MSLLELRVTTASLGEDAFLVTLSGEADLRTALALEHALDGIVGLGGTSVAVDLAGVGFIDSTALNVLLRYHGRFEALGGRLIVVTDDRRVLRTFEITGLDRIFAIERRLADAVTGIHPA